MIPTWSDSRKPARISTPARILVEKRSFNRGVRARRCLVPADGFYEWVEPTTQTTVPRALPDDGRLRWRACGSAGSRHSVRPDCETSLSALDAGGEDDIVGLHDCDDRSVRGRCRTPSPDGRHSGPSRRQRGFAAAPTTWPHCLTRTRVYADLSSFVSGPALPTTRQNSSNRWDINGVLARRVLTLYLVQHLPERVSST